MLEHKSRFHFDVMALCPLLNIIWGHQAGISNYVPQQTAGCNYLSLPEIPASGNKVLIFASSPSLIGYLYVPSDYAISWYIISILSGVNLDSKIYQMFEENTWIFNENVTTEFEEHLTPKIGRLSTSAKTMPKNSHFGIADPEVGLDRKSASKDLK